MTPSSPLDPRHARFEAVFTEVYEPLQRYAARRVARDSVADVVSETLLVVWRRIDDLPEGAELPWCYGVARRVLANERRAGARRLRLEERARGVAALPDDWTDWVPAGMVGVWDALGEVDGDDREILRLWAWEQLEAREVAVCLGISANAASIRLHRAKKRLADRIDRRKVGGSSGHLQAGVRSTEAGKEA